MLEKEPAGCALYNARHEVGCMDGVYGVVEVNFSGGLVCAPILRNCNETGIRAVNSIDGVNRFHGAVTPPTFHLQGAGYA